MFYDYRDFVVRKRPSRPPTPVVSVAMVGREPKLPEKAKKAEPPKKAEMHLAAVPLLRSDYQRVVNDEAYQPRLVPVPGTKVPLAPTGAREAKQVIKAAVVASQIAEELLISDRRIPEIVLWRAATYFTLRDLFPSMSRSHARLIMKRDRSTLIYFEKRRKDDPSYVADKVAAIKEVLV